MEIIDLHSHWGTERGYVLRTADALEQQQHTWNSKPRYETEAQMAAYLREIGLRFRALWQCAVMLVHHTGHQATERPRGSSAIGPV